MWWLRKMPSILLFQDYFSNRFPLWLDTILSWLKLHWIWVLYMLPSPIKGLSPCIWNHNAWALNNLLPWSFLYFWILIPSIVARKFAGYVNSSPISLSLYYVDRLLCYQFPKRFPLMSPKFLDKVFKFTDHIYESVAKWMFPRNLNENPLKGILKCLSLINEVPEVSKFLELQSCQLLIVTKLYSV